MTEIWAHRGASAYAPENSLEAFQEAIDQGADGVELDVHLSADGRVIVHHDATVERTSNGMGAVGDLTLRALRSFDYNAAMPGFRDVRLPTLADVLDLLAPTGMSVNVELKTTRRPYPGLLDAVEAMVARFGMADRIWYSSFNHETLRDLQNAGSRIPLGILYEHPLVDPWDYAVHMGVQALHPDESLVDDELIERSHALGLRVHPWTVDDPGRIGALVRLGADAVITNVPDVARRVHDAGQQAD